MADGETGGPDALFTLDPATGTLTEIGPLRLDAGLAALALGVAALGAVAARRRSRLS